MSDNIRYTYINEEHRLEAERALKDPRGPRPAGFAQSHPALPDAMYIDLFSLKYTRRSTANKVMEQWTKSGGQWYDTTREAQLAEDKEYKQRELVRVAKALMRAKKEESDGNTQTQETQTTPV